MPCESLNNQKRCDEETNDAEAAEVIDVMDSRQNEERSDGEPNSEIGTPQDGQHGDRPGVTEFPRVAILRAVDLEGNHSAEGRADEQKTKVANIFTEEQCDRRRVDT